MRQPNICALCVTLFFLFACGEQETAANLPFQPSERDMSAVPTDMAVSVVPDAEVLMADSGEMMRPDMMVDVPISSPNFGELIVNELMYDPQTLEDDNGEWIELRNVSSSALNLNGCTVVDGDHRETLEIDGVSLGGLVLEAGDYLLLARSDDISLNGGLTPDAVFEFGLSNSGDEIFVVCGAIEVDVVAYDDGETFPNAKGFSIVRGADASGAQRWCPATSIYDQVTNQRGTPKAANDDCGELVAPACWAQIDCPMDEFCMSGTCGLPEGRCRSEADCQEGEVCEFGQCGSSEPRCENDADCPVGQRCGVDGCEFAPDQPTPTLGQVVISEIMYNPHGPVTASRLDDNKAEWIELKNLTDEALSLNDCSVADASQSVQQLTRLVIPASGRVLLSRSLDPSENGDLRPQQRFDFGLNNSTNGELIRLRCDGEEIDLVEFSNPTEPAQAYQRSLSDLNRPNDAMSIWCAATEVYLADPEHLGTPLLQNTECP